MFSKSESLPEYPHVWVLSVASTFGKLSAEISVLKWESDVHFQNKTGLLLHLT